MKLFNKLGAIPVDKLLHFIVSYVLVHILSFVLHFFIACPFDAIGVSWAVTLFVVGFFLKEIIIDKERADSGDWLADVLGGTWLQSYRHLQYYLLCNIYGVHL